MATALPSYDIISGLCSNCFLFNWKQPENRKTLRKCTRCYVVAYCGMECQEEHWHKVHKNHCKYLGGLKKAKHSEHIKETCKTCIKSDSVGDLVFSSTNPNYVCIFEHVDWSLLPPTFPHPFPLHGPPEDRIEKMLNAAQKILLKIKVTENPVYLMQPQQVDDLERDLWDMRCKIYLNRICGGDQDSEMRMPIYRGTLAFVVDIFDSSSSAWGAIAGKAACYFYQMCGDDYKLLATLSLLIMLITDTASLHLEISLKFSDLLPRDYRQMSKKDEFFEVSDKIIEALDQEVVPFSELAAIACRGKTEQNCNRCHKKIVVQGIKLEDLPVRMPTAQIIFNPVENERYVCESSECYNKETDRATKKAYSWTAAVLATHRGLFATRCDHCFLLAALTEVHRSKCRTKNYCSPVCRGADDAAHKVCCDPDKGHRRIEERKVEAANATVDSFDKQLTQDMSPAAYGPEWVNLAEKVLGKVKKKTNSREKKKETQNDEVD